MKTGLSSTLKALQKTACLLIGKRIATFNWKTFARYGKRFRAQRLKGLSSNGFGFCWKISKKPKELV
jgi:hypothetical protein